SVSRSAGCWCWRWRPRRSCGPGCGAWRCRVAELSRRGPRPDPADRPVSTARMVATLYWSRVRSQDSFRASFLADVTGQVLIVCTGILGLWVILSYVSTLVGVGMVQVAVVYGLGALAFGLADLLFGEIDGLSAHIRSGKLETLLIRPVPVLLQISSLDLSLRRI